MPLSVYLEDDMKSSACLCCLRVNIYMLQRLDLQSEEVNESFYSNSKEGLHEFLRMSAIRTSSTF